MCTFMLAGNKLEDLDMYTVRMTINSVLHK